jgi:hypothetical protein
MSSKKNFFKSESVAKIKAKDSSFANEGLVSKILDLDEKKALIIDPIEDNPNQAYKYGSYFPLFQPRTRAEALKNKEVPLDIIIDNLKKFEKSTKFNEDQMFWNGYKYMPILANDSRFRIVSFVNILEAERLFGYSVNWSLRFKNPAVIAKQGIEIVSTYTDTFKATTSGASALVRVPSRTKGERKYEINYSSIPFVQNSRKYVLPWNLSMDFVKNPKNNLFDEHKMSSVELKDRNNLFLEPHAIAGYMAICNHLHSESTLPTDFSLFINFSKEAHDFYEKLNNNVLVASENKFRPLYRAEKNILIGRLIKTAGVDNTLRNKERDGPLREYFNK